MFQYIVLLFPAIFITACHSNSDSPFSPSALQDLSTFQMAGGLKVEFIASEPLIHDPVDMMIDEYGRMYVVEMAGVPLNKSGLGKIMLLSDSNGDGKMDAATVFADSLILPSGIMRWKNGVMVTDPPHVYYMEDTNNDGRADIKKIMQTGFDTSNLEANVNNPEHGLDNWVYLANLPVAKSDIHDPSDPDGQHAPESSLRLQPGKRKMEALSSQAQFGQSFDAWGRHFMVNNSNSLEPENYLSESFSFNVVSISS